MKKVRTISSDAFISCVCYALIGHCARKIKPQTLHLLCSKIIKNLQNNYDKKLNIQYSGNALINYIKNHDKSNIQYNNFYSLNNQVFYSILDDNKCLVFVDENNGYTTLINTLSRLSSSISHNLFTDMYPYIIELIEAYQLINYIDESAD